MKTFIDAQQIEAILNGFVQEGWLLKHGDGDATALVLTDEGKAKREAILRTVLFLFSPLCEKEISSETLIKGRVLRQVAECHLWHLRPVTRPTAEGSSEAALDRQSRSRAVRLARRAHSIHQ